jgi:hypothetical protein
LTGNLFRKELTYKLQMDWANDNGTNAIKDGWFDWQLMSGEYNLSVRAGQQKTGYGREHSISAEKLDFVDRAISTQALTNSRSRGVQLHGEAMENRLSWHVGLFNSDVASAGVNAGEDAANDDDELDYHFGVGWSSHPGKVGGSAEAGDLARSEELMWAGGANLQLGNYQQVGGASAGDVETFGINLWGEVKIDGFAVLGEFFSREDDADNGPSSDSDGFQVGVTYALAAADDSNDQWVFGVRVSQISIDDSMAAVTGGQIRFTPLGPATGEIFDIDLLAGFHDEGHNLKHQAGITLRNIDPDGAGDTDDVIVTIQTTLVF